MYVCNEGVSPCNIEESNNESDPNEEDNSESPISLENYLNNTQEKRLDTKLE